MELFSEIYSSYFRAVENVLRLAETTPLTSGEIQKVLSEGAFSESAFYMLPKLQNERWPLLHKTASGYAAVCVLPESNPLTILQKRWLKAVLNDPRIGLFLDDKERDVLSAALSDVDPLFSLEDFYVFDSAADGDNFGSESYRNVFRVFLTAVRQKSALFVQYEGRKGNRVCGVFCPYKLEYSPKDDKFRAHCYRKTGGRKAHYILNLGRVISLKAEDNAAGAHLPSTTGRLHDGFRQATIEITRERNALERCMVHFAHFEKRTEYDQGTDKYICTIRYNVMDEAEVVVRVLSFGPTIKVLGPDVFINEIRARVKKQAELITNNRAELLFQ